MAQYDSNSVDWDVKLQIKSISCTMISDFKLSNLWENAANKRLVNFSSPEPRAQDELF